MDIKKLWDKFTDNYSFLPIHPQYFIKKYTSTGIKLSTQYANGVLLDVGCGRMPYKDLLLQKANKYIGLDHPNTAKFYKGKDKPDIFADATKIPLSDKSCDTVIALQVLEHLPDPQAALSEAFRVLTPGGKLVVSTIQFYPVHDEPYDYFRYTKYGLEHIVKKAGFKVLQSVDQGNVFILIEQSFNIYLLLVLKNLTKYPSTRVLAVIFSPFILLLTTVLNILFIPFEFIDRKSKFRIIQTLVAIK